MPNDSTDFVVRLQGVKLTPAIKAKIAAEIQSTAMRELGRLDMKGDMVARIPHKEWLGIWIRNKLPGLDVHFPAKDIIGR
jgi:hypothetical protein